MACVIGIDVSKTRLDVCRLEDGRRLAVGNDAAGMSALVDRLGIGAQDLILMEASGGYERWRPAHPERGLRVAIVNAARAARLCPGERSTAARSPAWSGSPRSPSDSGHQARPPRHPRRPQAGAHRPLHGGCQQPAARPDPAAASNSAIFAASVAAGKSPQARPHRPDAQDARHPQCHAPHHHPLLTPSQRLLSASWHTCCPSRPWPALPCTSPPRPQCRTNPTGTRRDRRPRPRRQPRRDPCGLRAHAAARPRRAGHAHIAERRCGGQTLGSGAGCAG